MASPSPASTPSVPQSIRTAGRDAKALYEELQRFKDDPDFKLHGFAPCCKYNKWLKKAQALAVRTDRRKFLAVYEFSLGDLEKLGMIYVTGGNARPLEARIERGLEIRR